MRSQTAHIKENILLEMKNYSLNFEDKRFNMDVTQKNKGEKFYTLYEDENTLYMITPVSNTNKKEMMTIMTPAGLVMMPYAKESRKVFKVWYPKSDYMHQIAQVEYDFFKQFLFFTLGAMVIALLAAWYTLRPLRSSLHMLEDFIKDIIHDINTPLTSILLNLKMMKSNDDEIESIRTSVQTIEMLHHNLDAYIKEQKHHDETFTINEVIDRYTEFFSSLYDYLSWDIQVQDLVLKTDKQAFERIIYNLLSNACKYNTNNGKITISTSGTILSIRNSSYGVRNPHRVFERFYKESERGLGIGLHIVDKLCMSLGIEKKFIVENKDVIVQLDCKKIIA